MICEIPAQRSRFQGLVAAGLAVALLAMAVPGVVVATEGDLPRDFELSEVAWGGLGGGETRADCGDLTHHPVILVHGDEQGPESWIAGEGGGAVGALHAAGFDPCEVWALRVGEAGRPMRSLEELTDDVKVFIYAVLRYTGAPRVQLLAADEGAVLVHATLVKYGLHNLVHSAVYLDAPFGGEPDCNDDRCFGGEVMCCALRRKSGFLNRTLMPLETPHALAAIPDGRRTGHIRYLAVGSTPAVETRARTDVHGSWMLDGAWNLSYPELASRPAHHVPELWGVIVRTLSYPAAACQRADDGDGDGYCAVGAGGNDCDDANEAIYPGAPEVQADGIDQDCNLHDLDRSIVGWKCERPIGDPVEPTRLGPRATAQEEDDEGWSWQEWLVVVALSALLLPLGWVAYGLFGRRLFGRARRRVRRKNKAPQAPAETAPVKEEVEGLPPPATPDEEARRRPLGRRIAELIVVAAAFVAVVIVALAARGFDPALHYIGGNYEFVSWNLVDWNVHYWSMWDFRHVYLGLDNPLRSIHEFYPEGLLTVTVRGDLAMMAIAGFVGLFCSPDTTYLVMLAFILAGNGVGGFVLVRTLTGSRLAGLAVGVVFCFAGVTAWALNTGNLEYGLWLWICLYLAALDGVLRHGGRKRAVVAGVFALLAIYSNFLFIYHLAGLSAVLLAFRARRLDARRWISLGVLVATILSLLLPFAIYFRYEGKDQGQVMWPNAEELSDDQGTGQMRRNNSYALADYLPWKRGYTREHGEYHLFDRNDADTYYLLFAAVLVGLIAAPRRSLPWLVAGGLFLSLSLGPDFTVGSGEDAVRVPLPYTLAVRAVPLFYRIYFPHRIFTFALICAGVVMGYGVAWLLQRAGRPGSIRLSGSKGRIRLGGRRVRVLVGIAVVFAVFMELHGAWGIRTFWKHEVHPFYQQLGEDHEQYAMVVYPMDYGVFDARYLYFQTVHHKPLFNGTVPRYFGIYGIPNYEMLEENSILRRAYQLQMDHLPRTVTAAIIEIGGSSFALDRATLDQGIIDLLRGGFRYVILHRRVVWDSGLSFEMGHGTDLELFLVDALGRPAYEDDEIVVFDLRATGRTGP